MLESLMLLAQLNTQPQLFDGLYVPGRTSVEFGGYEVNWETHTRTSSQCGQYAGQQGYTHYVWSPSLQPSDGQFHVTGECLGIQKKQPGKNKAGQIEALEYEIRQGEYR